MNKSIIISSLLLFTSFNSILGDDDCSYYDVVKFEACKNVNLGSSGKSCVYLNDECKEQIAECNLYQGSNASECEAIIPQSNSYGTRCVFTNQECQPKEITSCSEYKSGLPEEFCNRISISEGVGCHFVNNECKTHYYYCSAYTGGDKNTCESIESNSDDPYESCSFTNNQCKKVKKTGLSCDSYKSGQDPEYCYYIELEDSKKYCEFYNNKCKEYFKKCSDYNGTNEEECNSNIPENYDEYKCVYKEGKCTEQQKTCSDYKEGEDYDYCEEISLDSENKKCQIINGKCTEVNQPVCEDYKGTNKNECQSIIPVNHLNKCVYTGGTCKEEPKTSCSEFTKGDDEYYCRDIQLTDYNKYCVFTNNECKESYNECSYYTGTDESICSSIIPQNGGKCEYKSNSCQAKTMMCSEFTSILDLDGGHSCERIYPSNELKKCVYSNYSCNEEDKYCLEFKSDATKEICEKALTSSNKKKCVLGDDKKSCIEKDGAYIIKAFSSLIFLSLLL